MYVYCPTSCYTCSFFHDTGKKKDIQVMCNAACELSHSTDLGTKLSLADTEKIPAFGILYEHSDCLSLNAICATHARINKVVPWKMPPINDSTCDVSRINCCISEELLRFQTFLFLTLWNLVIRLALKQASTLRNSWVMR